MTDDQLETEIGLLGYGTERDFGTGDVRGVKGHSRTPWRASLDEVLKDVENMQKPTEKGK